MIDLWTCHLLHWSWQHALLNAIAALPPIVAARRRGRLALFLLAAAPLIALAVRAGFDGEYRGASGLVVAAWVYVGIASRRRALLAAVALKLSAEALGWLPAHDGYVTVALAHYAGATVGLVAGYFEAAFAGAIEETVITPSLASPLTVTS